MRLLEADTAVRLSANLRAEYQCGTTVTAGNICPFEMEVKREKDEAEGGRESPSRSREMEHEELPVIKNVQKILLFLCFLFLIVIRAFTLYLVTLNRPEFNFVDSPLLQFNSIPFHSIPFNSIRIAPFPITGQKT